MLENYQASITNLGACGITRLCYNFMPVIDWTRTDLEHEWTDGSKALAFNLTEVAAFELHILCRPGAEARLEGGNLITETSAERHDRRRPDDGFRHGSDAFVDLLFLGFFRRRFGRQSRRRVERRDGSTGALEEEIRTDGEAHRT